MAAKSKFTDEQKAEILKRAEETSVAAAAKEFGVTATTIFRWKNATKENEVKAEKPEKKTRKKAAKEEAATEAAPAKKPGRKPKAEKAAAEAATEKKTTRKPKTEKAAAEAATEKKTIRKPKAEKAAAKATTEKKTTRKPKAEKAAAKATMEKKTTRKPKAEKAAVEEKAAAKIQIILQSPFNHEITPDGILAKIPEGTEKVYVRIDQNKIYWVKGEENGDVDIW